MTLRKRSLILVSGILILALALGVTAAFAQDDDEPVAPDPGKTVPAPGWGQGRGRGFGQQLEGLTPLNELVAAELGVDADDLQAALTEARQAAVAAAQENGAFRFPRHRGFAGGEEFQTYLADALADIGVTVEELEAAQEVAHDQLLEEMVAAGYMDAEQAELIKARKALKEYIDREAILEEVLGLSLEELQEARQAGTPLSELLGDRTFEEFAAEMQVAHEAAVEQAVADGVITADQAEQLQDGPRSGFAGLGGCGAGSHGFGRGRGFGPASGLGPADGLGPANGNAPASGIGL
jgi:hypothetical protein